MEPVKMNGLVVTYKCYHPDCIEFDEYIEFDDRGWIHIPTNRLCAKHMCFLDWAIYKEKQKN